MADAPAALTAQFVEREYNNRALVPDHGAYFARWERDSEFVRSTLPCTLDVPYGPDARHRIDFFPAANAIGTLVFIHGGYWRTLDKGMFSWLAAAYVAAGVNVAMPNYRFSPTVPIEAIVDDIIAAVNLVTPGSDHLASVPIVVSGHSAGGHLTAALLAAPAGRVKHPERIVGGVPISGIFDFAPLKLFSFNADFKLDDAAVERLNLYGRKPTIPAPLVIAAGAAESSEFQRQSSLLAERWSAQTRSLLLLPSLNHFSVVDAFAERGQPLYEQTLALLRGLTPV